MTKREFQRRINEAEEIIDHVRDRGVCHALFWAFHEYYLLERQVPWYFSHIFSPDGDYKTYWLGPFDEQNLEKRIFYLGMFEAYMLENNLHKKVKRR